MSFRTLLALALVITCGLHVALAQQPAAPPSPAPQRLPVFPGGVEQVVVDVVVLDGDGRAVTGLVQEDFTLSEEKAERPVLSFEAVAPADDAATAAANDGAAGRAPLTRVFALVFDDLHLTVAGGGRVKEGLKEMAGGVLRDSDEVALLTTSNGQVWSGRVGSQRKELLAAIDRQHGLLPPSRSCEMTDEEAMQIHIEHDTGVQQLVFERLVNCGLLTRQATPLTDQVLPNRAQTQAPQGAPQTPRSDVPGMSMLESWATDQHEDATRRVRATYASLERLLWALGPVRGRKTVVLGSEGFVRDRGLTAIQGVVNAASDTNAAVYFLDARTLAPRVLTASGDARHAPGTSELGRLQQGRFFGAEASEQLAVETGGAAIRGGDLAAGLRRLADESRTYYLLGYTPADPALDGRFRSITVKVKRPGLTVRARRGYYALARTGPAPANVAVTTAAAAPPPPPVPAAPPPPVAPNPDALAVYLRPSAEAAATVARWSPQELQRAVEALKAGSASDDVLEAAALAHAAAALGEKPTSAQARAAVQAAGLLDNAERRRALETRVCLGLAHGFLEARDWATAQELAEEASTRVEANADALLALGIVQETTGSVANGGHRPNPDQTLLTAGYDEMMARNPVGGFAAGVPGGPRQPQFGARMGRPADATAETRLKRAAESYRRALKARPELTEARLRLGRTLALLGDDKGAAQELAAVAAKTGEPDLAYLAHLFLGDLREQQQAFADAAREYQAAQALRPSSAVARLALARAQHATGERGAAAKALQALLLDAPPRDSDRDPWWSYRLRPLGRFAGGLGSSGQ